MITTLTSPNSSGRIQFSTGGSTGTITASVIAVLIIVTIIVFKTFIVFLEEPLYLVFLILHYTPQ